MSAEYTELIAQFSQISLLIFDLISSLAAFIVAQACAQSSFMSCQRRQLQLSDSAEISLALSGAKDTLCSVEHLVRRR